MEGTLIDGKYEVLRQLGQGGMGAVYEARHRSTGRKVAIKVIVPAALAGGVDILARFQREARASGSIESPFVVQVLDAGVDSTTGAPYMAMECLAGEDVQHLVQRLGALPPHVVLRITAQACHGLQKAHENGIVHRDIKSANLFVAKRDGATGEMITKILDFGIAKVRASPLPGEDHKLTKTGSMLGSPVYMSPEQAIGSKDLDARSDIFSMGVMMYEALTGATPNGHLENLGALLMAICSQPAQQIQERAPWLPPEIAAVVHKALAVSPADRYQSAAELRAAAVALLPGGGTTLLEDMLVSLPAETKNHRAPRLSVSQPLSAFAETVLPPTSASTSNVAATTNPPGSSPNLASGPSAVNAASAAGPPSAPMVGGMSTTAGLGVSEFPARGVPRPFRWGALVAGFAALLAVGGAGTAYLRSKKVSASDPGAPIALQAASSSSAPAAAFSPAAPLAGRRTDSVAVLPPDATVEVDTRRVTVESGRFDVSGEIGSVHHVRVTSGTNSKELEIVLAATGPIPGRVELVLPRPGVPAGVGGRRPVAPSNVPPTGPAVASAPAAPPPVIAPAAAAPKPPPQVGIGADRKMD